MANNEYVNRVDYGNDTLIDISDTTAEAGDVIQGQTFYTRSGAPATGTLGDATQSMHGLMSAADKTKLDGMSGIAYQEIEIPITVANWSNSAPYTYTWTNAAITTNCCVTAMFKNDVRSIFNGNMNYDKVTGGVQFTVTEKPTDTVTIILQVIDGDTTYVLNPTIISNQVTTWLNQNVNSSQTIVVDQSLSISGAAADAAKVGELKSAFINSIDDCGMEILEVTNPNSYLNTSGARVEITEIQPSTTGYNLTIAECSPGDVFTISATGGSNARAWCFIQLNGTPILKSGENETVTDLCLTAPKNAKYLIINSKNDSRLSYKGKTTGKKLEELTESEQLFTGAVPIQLKLTGYSLDTSGTVVNPTGQQPETNMGCTNISCSEGDTFVITGTGGNNSRLWCFANQSNGVVSASKANATESNLFLVAPYGANKLYLNVLLTATYGLYKFSPIQRPKMREIPLEFEQGSFNGSGVDSDSNKRIRTRKVAVNPKCLYMIIVDGYGVGFNALITGYSRMNYTSMRITYPFSIRDCNGFIRLNISDASNPDNDLPIADFDDTKVRLFEVQYDNIGDIVVAKSTDAHKEEANVIVTDDTEQDFLQALIGHCGSIGIRLMAGNYHLTKKYTTIASGQNACLTASELSLFGSVPREVKIRGGFDTRTRVNGSTTIYADTDNIFGNTGENSILLIPRAAVSKDTTDSYSIELDVDGISFIGNTYQKPVIGIDATQAKSCRINRVYVRHDGLNSTLPVHTVMPNEGCIGIRAGHGSCNGAENYIRSTRCFYAGKGFSICGEHYIIEDCLAHHCKYGFAFGDEITRLKMEHPNIMIGCSIEACYQLMYLTKNGVTTEADFVVDRENGLYYSTLHCIGLSTESTWHIPGTENTQITLPIFEVLHGAYRGMIEADYHASLYGLFSDGGSGRNLSFRRYNEGNTYYRNIGTEVS